MCTIHYRYHKFDTTTIDDAEDWDLAMPMYNLLECSSNYSHTTGTLWSHSKDEANNYNADIGEGHAFKSFKYKAKLLENAEPDGVNGVLRNTNIAVALKYLSIFWRSLEVLLIIFK